MAHQNDTDIRRNGHGANGHTPQGPSPPNGALDILWDGLPPKVAEQLSEPLDPALVSHRKGRAGRTVPYMEGHAAIAQANRIFGHGGWGYEVAGDVVCREIRSVEVKTGETLVTQLYCAAVRITVPGVPPRTDVGCQPVAEDTADDHDAAYKGAVTDALKRALRAFGDQFGNALYGEGAEPPSGRDAGHGVAPALRQGLAALAAARGMASERFHAGVRKRTGKELDTLSATELAPLVEAMAKKAGEPADGSQPSNGSRPWSRRKAPDGT